MRSTLATGGEPQAANRAGLRFIGDIIGASSDEYYRRWTTVNIGDLCKETAHHVQVVARVTDAKFQALNRVYNGLTAMTALSAIMVTVLAYARLMQ